MVEFRNVSKVYPNGSIALANVSFSIPKGELVFIIGASGAGKSTLLKMIIKEENPTKGDVFVNGRNLSTVRKKDIPYLRRTIGIVFQDFRLIDKMNVYENIAFGMYAIGCKTSEIKKRVPYIIDLVGLKSKYDSFPHEISGGEQQRVALARALVNNPSLIIADEPTGNIDPTMSTEIMALLYEINKRGTTILVVTHEQSLVKHFNQRIIEIEDGQVINDKNSSNKHFITGSNDYEV